MTPEAKPLTDTQRMWDLVRHQRSELFNADLITDDEYAALAEDGNYTLEYSRHQALLFFS